MSRLRQDSTQSHIFAFAEGAPPAVGTPGTDKDDRENVPPSYAQSHIQTQSPQRIKPTYGAGGMTTPSSRSARKTGKPPTASLLDDRHTPMSSMFSPPGNDPFGAVDYARTATPKTPTYADMGMHADMGSMGSTSKSVRFASGTVGLPLSPQRRQGTPGAGEIADGFGLGLHQRRGREGGMGAGMSGSSIATSSDFHSQKSSEAFPVIDLTSSGSVGRGQMVQNDYSYDRTGSMQSSEPFQSPIAGGRAGSASTPLANDRLENVWIFWILVVGVSPSFDAASVGDVLRRFQEFGDIVDHACGRGNWVFVKFGSPQQAERASAVGSQFLNSSTMLSVQPMSSALARSMGLRIDSHGSLRQDPQAVGGAGSAVDMVSGADRDGGSGDGDDREPLGGFSRIGGLGSGYRNVLDPNHREEYLRPPARSSNICRRLMQFFFSF